MKLNQCWVLPAWVCLVCWLCLTGCPTKEFQSDGGSQDGIDQDANQGKDEPLTDQLPFDRTAPTTIASPAAGLYQTAQTVTLTCKDEESGCLATHYTLDGSAPTLDSPQYILPLEISQTSTLKFFSIDRAGNKEKAQTANYAIVGPLPPWACEVPAAPAAPESGYHHQRKDFAYPDSRPGWTDLSTQLFYRKPLAISGNGRRIAFGFNLDRINDPISTPGRFHRSLYLFAAGQAEPLWVRDFSPPPDQLAFDAPRLVHLDFNRDGRGLVAGRGNNIMFFACDNPEPLWTFHTHDNNVGELWRVRAAPGGDWLVITTAPTISADTDPALRNRYRVLVFRRDLNMPWTEIPLDTIHAPVVDVSADGSRIAIMTERENPDDLAGETESTHRENFVHARLMMYQNGVLQWSQWIRHECAGCDPEYLAFYGPGPSSVVLSADGATLAASGPGGRIIRLDADAGTQLWEYADTLEESPGRMSPRHLTDLRISDDGRRIAARSSLLAFGDNTVRGILYFDEDLAGVPVWSSADALRDTPDCSPTTTPTPNGFLRQEEEGFPGFAQIKYGKVQLPSRLADLGLSAAGDLLTVSGPIDFSGNFASDQVGGHAFAFYKGSPLPFQVISEDEPSRDSDLVWSSLATEAPYLAAVAIDPDAWDGHQEDLPRISLHLFEIPPGVILNIQTQVTFKADGLTGDIIELLSDADSVLADEHVVKPGRAANLRQELQLTTLIGDQFFDLCLPWQTNKTRHYDLSDGLQAVSGPLEWSTPTCLTSAIGVSEMVMRVQLYDAADVLQDERCDSYLNFSWVIPTK